MSRLPRVPRPSAAAFAERYRQERERIAARYPDQDAGVILSRLMLSAFHGSSDPEAAPLRPWLAGLSADDLAALLETVLEGDSRRKELGIYATGADIARHMAVATIIPFLLSGLAYPAEELADQITGNHDLERMAGDWLSSADAPARTAFRRRLRALTILDPTCGTGPFLLAALRVLEPLHAAASVRRISGQEIRRRIVTRNLYGMDLSAEAVAICRLRLMPEAGADAGNHLRVGNVLSNPLPFADVRARGGFDVILGNPPYLELREVPYATTGFRCQDSGAVHALCVERGLDLLQPLGRISMLVPMSLVSTQRMKPVQDLLEAGRDVWYANFSWRPARLFAGVHRAITLFLAAPSDRPRTWSTGYLKWRTRERSGLLRRLAFVEVPRDRPAFWVPKLGDRRERPLLDKLLRVPTTVADFLGKGDTPDRRIYYRTDGGLYWKVFTDFAPSFRLNGRAGHSTRETWLTVADPGHLVPLIAVLSSDLFWWWYTVTSNCRHLNPIDVHRFPVPASALADPELARLGRAYLADIVRRSRPGVRRQKQTGHTETQTFRIRESRAQLLAIGRALAPHYGLKPAEADFLAAYDLDFRMSGAR